ncbi:hypothetical protein DFP72DRAFT_1059205 [Ephemerocybe angulata]|uniref:Uncharacterized protein n=1 Tax=Ephemerocybe angulata TaxID=980116 RepID=A0A8H6IGZ9_9AGAR|nr:hypothetical protein DFP72DRAFT_1059205 [Tulosesus angulatus]
MDSEPPGTPSWSEKCACGKVLYQPNTYTNHIRTCARYKARLGSNLVDAQARYRARKQKGITSKKGKEVKTRYGDQDLDIDDFAVAIATAEPMASGSGASVFESMDPQVSEAGEDTQMTALYTKQGQRPPEPEAMNVDQQTAADADDDSEQPGHRRSKRLRNMKAKQPIEDKLASTVPIDSVPLSSVQSGEPVTPQGDNSHAPAPAEARRGILDDNSWKSTPVNVFGLYKRYWTLEKAPPDPDHFITIEDLDDSAKPTTASQGDLSKLGPLSNPFHPFPNLSSFLLGEWFWSDEEKSRESFQRLIDIITREDFSPQDVRLAKWDKINSALASSEFEDRAGDEGQLWLDDGTSWQVTSIPLDVPFNKSIGTHPYVIPNFRYRPLIPIILDRLQNSNGHGDYFHFLPTDLRWRTEDGLDVRVYGDLHHSPAFLQAYRDIQLLAPELSEDSLPRYVLGMMFASDATTLATFGGSANIWPLYLLLGNDSKYRRGRPSLQLFEEVAYFQTLPDQFTDWYIQHRPGKKGAPDTMRTHLKRELFQAQWRVLLDDEFVHAYEHGLVVDCFDNVRRRVYPRIMTYSADYPEKIMVVNIRQKGDHPCTRCLIHIDDIAGMGSNEDRLKRESERRKDGSERKKKVLQARKYIYKRYNAVTHKDVEELLKPSSLVPTENAFSERLSRFGLDIYSLPAVDILHEVEIGIWKDLFIQLLRMLEVVDKTRIPVLNARFRAIATFGSDTIRRFSNNVSGMKQFAARDYENILQCALPAFEGLFPVEHEARIQDVLFTMAHWHSLAKMRIHTDLTLTVLDLWTTTLGEDCRLFEEKTCKAIPTQELQREYEARKRREARERSKKDKAATSGKAGQKKETPASTIPTALGQVPLAQVQAPAAATDSLAVPATSAAHSVGGNGPEPSASSLAPSGDGVLATPAGVVPIPKSSSRAAEDDGRKAKSWNLNVPKFHGLGYVASYIRAYGTTDSYSTQQSERFHRFSKARYRRTNKKDVPRQISQIQARQTRIKKLRKRIMSGKGKHDRDIDDEDPREWTLQDGRPSRYFIGKSQNMPVNLDRFLRINAGDPAMRNFLPKLKRHLFPRLIADLLHEARNNLDDYSSSIPALESLSSSFSDNDLNHLYLHSDRIYRHSILRIRYTTYDCRRDCDIIKPSSAKHDFMSIRGGDTFKDSESTASDVPMGSNSEEGHHYVHGRVLGVFHTNLIYGGPGKLDLKKRRFDFLWVRWYIPEEANEQTWASKRLDRLSLAPLNEPESCDFLDPRDVLRAAHIIPRFSLGQKYDPKADSGRIFSKAAKDVSEWKEYIVNRFVDRDMTMRFHWGLAVGHTYTNRPISVPADVIPDTHDTHGQAGDLPGSNMMNVDTDSEGRNDDDGNTSSNGNPGDGLEQEPDSDDSIEGSGSSEHDQSSERSSSSGCSDSDSDDDFYM